MTTREVSRAFVTVNIFVPREEPTSGGGVIISFMIYHPIFTNESICIYPCQWVYIHMWLCGHSYMYPFRRRPTYTST